MKAWAKKHTWAVVVLCILIAGGVIFGMCKIARHRLKVIPGTPKGELFIAGSPGTVIVIDHVAVGGGKGGRPTDEGERLTAIDADTGAELAVDVTSYKECWSGGARPICVDKFDRVDVLDPRTLEVAAEANDLIAAAKLAKPTRNYKRQGNAAIVMLEDGRGALIDAEKLTVTALDSVESGFTLPASSSCETDYGAKLGEMRLLLGDGSRNTLQSEPPPPAESATPMGPPLTFLEGRFLRAAPGIALVLHKETTSDPKQLLSRVEGISKEKWKAPLGGACRRAWVNGPLLVVVTETPGQRALAIDLASGRIAWTFGR